MKQVEVYTDGACSGNPGPGGWGAVLRYRFNGKVYEKELSGGDDSTTNNRMELTAFIEALRQLKEPCEVRLCSDSQYVINGLQKGLGQKLAAPGLEKSRWLPCPEPGPLGTGTGAGSPAQDHLCLGQRATQATRRTNAATSWPWPKAKHMAGGREHERHIFARQRVRHLRESG